MGGYPKQRQTRRQNTDESTSKLRIRADDLLRVLQTHLRQYLEGHMVVEVGLPNGQRVDAMWIRYSGKAPTAFEVKTNRADWLTEMKEPAKHQAARDLAGQLYFVAPPGIIEPHEIPDGTGLYEINALTRKVRCTVKADRREPAMTSWDQVARMITGAFRAFERGIT